MSSQNTHLIAGFDTARRQTNRYLTTAMFIIGVIGNVFNVIVFSHPTFNRIPTTRYLLAASGTSLASLTSGLLGRIVSGWGSDPASRNNSLCKFQAYTNKLGQTSCSYFILAAAIDRWLQSSRNVHHRQLSSIKNSTRTITLILLVFGIYHCIHAICDEAFLAIPPIKCYAGSIICRYFENISYALVTILIPQLMMLFFGWKNIQNLRQSQRCIGVNVIYNFSVSHGIAKGGMNRNVNQAKIRSMTRMLIMQVLAYILFTLPAAGEALYMTVTLPINPNQETDLKLVIDRFFFAFTAMMSYMSISLSFYLYILTGSTFRQTFIKIIRKPKFWQHRQ